MKVTVPRRFPTASELLSQRLTSTCRSISASTSAGTGPAGRTTASVRFGQAVANRSRELLDHRHQVLRHRLGGRQARERGEALGEAAEAVEVRDHARRRSAPAPRGRRRRRSRSSPAREARQLEPRRGQRRLHLVRVAARRLLPGREVLERRQAPAVARHDPRRRLDHAGDAADEVAPPPPPAPPRRSGRPRGRRAPPGGGRAAPPAAPGAGPGRCRRRAAGRRRATTAPARSGPRSRWRLCCRMRSRASSAWVRRSGRGRRRPRPDRGGRAASGRRARRRGGPGRRGGRRTRTRRRRAALHGMDGEPGRGEQGEQHDRGGLPAQRLASGGGRYVIAQ